MKRSGRQSIHTRCPFCGHTHAFRVADGLVHPRRRSHGPFAFFECGSCGSGLTVPPPSEASLRALYGSYSSGLPDELRRLTADDPQSAWYDKCARRIKDHLQTPATDVSRWIEFAPGGGELTARLSALFPRATGTAVDLHERPADFKDERVAWKIADLNEPSFATAAGGSADVVVAVAIWEHVRQPDVFVHNLLSLLNPGGLLFLACPNYASAARRLMGRRWPYFIPGEHLCMPTPAGARACLTSACHDLGMRGAQIACRPIAVPYTTRYLLAYAGLGPVARLTPSGLGFPTPAGALQSTVIAPI